MKIKNRQQLLVVVTLAAVGLFIGDSLILTPLMGFWSARDKRVQELRAKLKEGESLIGREKVLTDDWARLSRSSFTSEQSEAEQRIHKVIYDCSSVGVRISSITTDPWKVDNSGEYMTMDCRVQADGSLRAVKEFLLKIEQQPVALKEQGVELSCKDNNGQTIQLGLHLSALALIPKKSTP
jgi:hypothetical protein